MRSLAAVEQLDLADLDLSRLTPREQDELIVLMENRLGGEGLADYIRRTRHSEPPPRHLLPIIGLFERARRERVRACISMPPGSGKSTTLRSAVAWWLTHSPADVCAYTSYNGELAGEQSYKVRDEARRVGVELAPDHQARDDWRTRQGGGLIAAGVETMLTGRRVSGFALVDDPFRDPKAAMSPVTREDVWEWFHGVVMTRPEGWASVIVVHTRWHEDDLIGRLKKQGGWEIINIPALAEDGEPDVLGRQPGESFWPERPQFTTDELEGARSRNEFLFTAMYQGRPRSKGTKVFWGPPVYYDPKTVNHNGMTAMIGADPAASTKTSADWSVAGAMAITPNVPAEKARGRILDVYRKQVSVPMFARHLVEFIGRHWNAPAAVEAVGAFKALPQTMYEAAPLLRGRIRELSSPEQLHGDKFLRAQSFATAWNEGRIEIPMSAPWVEEFLAEIDAFTGTGKDKNDDQVDALSHAWNSATGGSGPVKRGAVAQPGRWR